jgi:hypothetical protein
MNFPGKKLLRHGFWILAFRYPRLRRLLMRLFVPSRDINVQIFGAPLCINTREETGIWRAAMKENARECFARHFEINRATDSLLEVLGDRHGAAE